jgi:ABC-2 type transport system ATP-binding protein
LAIALSHHAELIILDEPTSGLDPVFRREFLDILLNIIQDEKKSILFSTHITTDLEKIADYITFIKNGDIIFSDIKDDILENWAIVRGSKDELNETIKKVFKGIQFNKYGFEGLVSDKNLIINSFSKNIVIEKATLEDIMYFIVKGDNNA